MSHAEWRFDERHEVDFPVWVVGPDGQRMSQALDLSAGGLKLRRGHEPLEPGTELELALRLPDLEGPITCVGTVVYQRGPVAGVEFVRVPGAARERIEEFIAARSAPRR